MNLYRTLIIMTALSMNLATNAYSTTIGTETVSVPAYEIPASGKTFESRTESIPTLNYKVYLPPNPASVQHVLVSVHGISRNVDEHLSALKDWADEYNVALILPHFEKLEFHDYQRLGREGHGPRADLALLRVLHEVQSRFNLNTQKVDLFGYSGGAQFVHRFAMAFPHRVRRLGVASAGWYTWPDSSAPYPMGTQLEDSLPGVSINLDRFMEIPICVFVGKEDIHRDRSLNTDSRIDRIQGKNRRDRASNWVTALKKEAKHRNKALKINYVEMPDTTHAFKKAITRGGLMNKLFTCFYPE